MPGDLRIPDLDDETVRRLKQRAARNGQSAEAEVLTILRAALADHGPTLSRWRRTCGS